MLFYALQPVTREIKILNSYEGLPRPPSVREFINVLVIQTGKLSLF